jgi:hypothetical protein
MVGKLFRAASAIGASLFDQLIAAAVDGDEKAWLGGLGLDLLAQTDNEVVHGTGDDLAPMPQTSVSNCSRETTWP